MANDSLKGRVAALEAEVARIKDQIGTKPRQADDPCLEDVWGAFANDPDFLEAMRLGQQWRESFRPKSRRQHKKK